MMKKRKASWITAFGLLVATVLLSIAAGTEYEKPNEGLGFVRIEQKITPVHTWVLVTPAPKLKTATTEDVVLMSSQIPMADRIQTGTALSSTRTEAIEPEKNLPIFYQGDVRLENRGSTNADEQTGSCKALDQTADEMDGTTNADICLEGSTDQDADPVLVVRGGASYALLKTASQDISDCLTPSYVYTQGSILEWSDHPGLCVVTQQGRMAELVLAEVSQPGAENPFSLFHVIVWDAYPVLDEYGKITTVVQER